MTLYMDITRWSVLKPDWLYFATEGGETPHSQQKPRPGADCASDHELLIAKFRLKLKKGKTTRPLRYDLNQIPYDYTVEVMNRFKGWDLVDRVSEELWMQVPNTVQEVVIKTIPKKEKCKKAKWLSEEALQMVEKWRKEKSNFWERERYTQLNVEFQRMARGDKKAFLSKQCKEIEEYKRMERLAIYSRKLEIEKEHFMQG